METFNEREFSKLVPDVRFVQDNHSTSNRGVLRGLHFQDPHAQGKLVRVTAGSVYDVIVDLRKDSQTFGQWYGCTLDAVSHQQIWIPPGLAHGFITLEDRTEFLYKCSDFYDPSCEQTLKWDDPDLAVQWPELDCPIIISERDRHGISWREWRQ